MPLEKIECGVSTTSNLITTVNGLVDYTNTITTQQLIDGYIESVAVGDEVETSGFYAVGDGGGAKWLLTETTSTPSQAPKDTGSLTFTDSEGRVFSLIVKGGEVFAKSVGVIADSVTDDTLALRAAGSSLYVVNINQLKMKITDQVSFRHIRGGSVGDTKFIVNPDFNMSASSIIKLTGNDISQIHDAFTVQCAQSDVSTRAECNQYPWALDFSGITRVSIDGFRCTGAWNGVDSTGNTGGAKIGTLEVGALNVGLELDGALDFWHADTLHFWPFGIVTLTNLLNDVYYDTQTVAANIGSCDGLDIKTLSAFRTKVNVFNGVYSRGPFGIISALQLDGNNASLYFEDGHLSVGTYYSTSAYDGDIGVNCTGGKLVLSSHDITPFINAVSSTPFIECDGGDLVIGCGSARASSENSSVYKCTSGNMTLANTVISSANVANRTTGFVSQDGGTLKLSGITLPDKGSSIGVAIEINAGENSSVEMNNMKGWDYTLPGTFGNNNYTFPEDLRVTPELKITNTGDLSPTYSQRYFDYSITNNIVKFNCLLQFDTNAYSTASGGFSIATNCPYKPPLAEIATIGAISNISYSTGSIISSEVDQSSGELKLRVSNSGAGLGNLSVTNIPASTSGVVLKLTGSYRAN